tara:strand:- start:4778 stop:5047 length:270 start_codon:yes stop_codon:yes gene_type:complete
METKTIEKELTAELLLDSKELILYNDDFNTFEHVIDSLVAICEHSPNQAEQCAYIVHYNGKCTVKKGSIDKLQPMLKALQLQRLTVKIK